MGTAKKYRSGMFAGKFMPYHLGHLYCLRTASELCDRVYQILMTGCVDEEKILRSVPPEEREALSPENRYRSSSVRRLPQAVQKNSQPLVRVV